MQARMLPQFIVLMLAFSFSPTAVHAGEDFAPQTIAQSERCPVCGMYPARFPQWHAQIVFRDGEHTSFDSAAEVFRFLNDMAQYDSKHAAADIGKIFVPAYGTGAWLDARLSFFVAGSKAKGPMGSDFPAFASKEEAIRFTQTSGGKMLTFDQATAAVLADSSHMHTH
ncbi:MAG TPA: nitrous oxide reductase accessory protein NosL [Gallionellaceae bacterium]